MISKNQISYVRSLHQKKFRQMYGKYLVEGAKMVNELLKSESKIDTIYFVAGFSPVTIRNDFDLIECSPAELDKISTQEKPDKCLAVVNTPVYRNDISLSLPDELYIACDEISDPGNAGTIVRIADWFGIRKIFFSENSVDFYNPKTVAASKGAIFRTELFSVQLCNLFESNRQLPVIGAAMDGDSLYHTDLPNKGFIVIGNEANGLSENVEQLLTKKITIPRFGKAESLNAGVAAGIIVSEFLRRKDN